MAWRRVERRGREPEKDLNYSTQQGEGFMRGSRPFFLSLCCLQGGKGEELIDSCREFDI